MRRHCRILTLIAALIPISPLAAQLPISDSSPSKVNDKSTTQDFPTRSTGAADRQRLEFRRNMQRNLSRAEYALQRFVTSLNAAERAAELTRDLSGDSAADLAEDLRWKVQVLMDLGRYNLAREAMKEVVAIREKHKSLRPALILEANSYLAYVERVEKLTPDQHRTLSASTRELAEALRWEQLGRNNEAIREAENGLNHRKEVLGYADEMYFEHLAVYAVWLLEAGRTERAITKSREALEGYGKLLGNRHRRYASTLNATALLLGRMGNVESALPMHEEATDIYLHELGNDHRVAQQSMEMLDSAYRRFAQQRQQKGNYQQAADVYSRAARAWDKVLGPSHWRSRDAELHSRFLVRIDGLTVEQQRQWNMAVAWHDEAMKHLKAVRASQGIVLARKAHKTFSELAGEESPAALDALNNLATLLEADADFSEADATLRQLWTMRSSGLGSNHPSTLESLAALLNLWETHANVQREAEDWQGVKASLATIASLAAKGYGPRDWRAIDHQMNLKHYTRIAELTAVQRRRLEEAQQLYDSTNALRESGRNALAIERMTAVMKERLELLGSSDRTANCYHALGELYRRVGDYSESQRFTHKALELRETLLGKHHPKYADSLHNWGVLLSDQRDPARAVDALRRSLEITDATHGLDSVEHVRVANGLAMVYIMAFGNLAEAEPLLQDALQVCQQKGFQDQSLHARVLNNLAGVYKDMGRLTLAEELFGQASTLWQKQGVMLDYAKALDNLANLKMRRTEFADALRMRQEALGLFQQYAGPRHPDTVICLDNIASDYLVRGQLDEALAIERKALSAAQHNLRLVTAGVSEQQELRAFRSLRHTVDALLTITANDRERDSEAYACLLNWKGVVFLKQRWQRLVRSSPAQAPQVEQLRQITAQLATLGLHPPHPDDRPQWQNELRRLDSERAEIERRLRTTTRDEPLLVEESSSLLPRIQGVVRDKEALVDFFGYKRRRAEIADGRVSWQSEMHLAAFVVRSGTSPVRIELGPAKPIINLLEQWRRTYVRSTVPRDTAGTANALRNLLWVPLIPELNGIETVAIVPDGPLAMLPFSALPGKQPTDFLLEDYTIVRVPAAHLLVERENVAQRATVPGAVPSLLLVGDVDFGKRPADGASSSNGFTFRRLGATGPEIVQIQQGYEQKFRTRPTVLSGQAATETMLREKLPTRQYIHLATHGFYLGRASRMSWLPSEEIRGFIPDLSDNGAPPLDEGEEYLIHPGVFSGVAFAHANRPAPSPDQGPEDDGILTAAEVADLDLRCAQLVVLSACETGLGTISDGEGLIGLERAFHLAGASNTITTAWSVADKPAQVFMSKFYSELWRADGVTPAQALRATQLWMLRDVPRNEQRLSEMEIPALEPAQKLPPFYWAAYGLSAESLER